MPTPLSLEQRILIAAEYNADRVEVIKELMREDAKNFHKWCHGKVFIFQRQVATYDKMYEFYLQSNKQVKP